MTIDGYYVPDEIAAAAEARADALGKHQHIGVVYNREPIRDVTLSGVFSPLPFFADARLGRNCTWVYGPEYAELKKEDKLAVILWISPRRAA